jgi:hypothetical protein
VLSAEAAEKEADRALIQARAAVKAAREEVKRLEHEAAEEYVYLTRNFLLEKKKTLVLTLCVCRARLAKIKQKEAQSISKRAKPLGRKFILEWTSPQSGCFLQR